MAIGPKSTPQVEPSTGEHGVWGYEERAVGGFGESYDSQVARGEQSDEPSADPADEALEQAVRKKLAHAHIDAADLRVVVRSRAVLLLGSVHDQAEKEQLEARARAVPGVASVQSRLVPQRG